MLLHGVNVTFHGNVDSFYLDSIFLLQKRTRFYLKQFTGKFWQILISVLELTN